MKWWDIIDEHTVIRETVGYDVLKDIDLADMPEVIKFLKICHNCIKMQNIGEQKSE
jgi:hypothetical protein